MQQGDARYTMLPKAPFTLDKDSAKTIIEWESDGHNGAAVCFGNDGMLYVTTGDGTSDSDTNVTGQRMDLLLAKLMRIDVDHPDEGKAYSVPKDNPFVGQPNIRPETWAYGFRNPWRIHCDKKTGHIWVGNNGQDLWEQIYFVRKGDNYGWSVYEGGHPFYLERKLGPTPHVKPAIEHPHSEARSMTGGIVYYGTKFPELVGAYIYGDYSTGRIWAAKHDGERVVWHKELAQTRLQITGFGTDSKGEILICDHNSKNGGELVQNTGSSSPKNCAALHVSQEAERQRLVRVGQRAPDAARHDSLFCQRPIVVGRRPQGALARPARKAATRQDRLYAAAAGPGIFPTGPSSSSRSVWKWKKASPRAAAGSRRVS